MKKIGLISLLLFCQYSLFGQSPQIQWQKCYGGSRSDGAYSIASTPDGGFIMAGFTGSSDGDVSGLNGPGDAWVVKIDGIGDLQWQKTIGGSGFDDAYAIQPTADKGYIMAGTSSSGDGDLLVTHGKKDFWIVKIDSLGNVQWQKLIGGSEDDHPNCVIQARDGGYVVSGYTSSFDGDVLGNHGMEDAWVVKLNASGTVQWKKCFGGSNGDLSTSVVQTEDGGYVLSGGTGSDNGDVYGNHSPYIGDAWVLKLSATGKIEWQKCLGGTSSDGAGEIRQTSDRGYILFGGSGSNDGDVSGNHGKYDLWVVKLDTIGNIQWQKCFGGSEDDFISGGNQTLDKGYIIIGSPLSVDGDVSGLHVPYDYWVLKLDSLGNLEWQKCLGGSLSDRVYGVQQASDGGYVVAGYSESVDGDVIGNNGNYPYTDLWVVKLDNSTGTIQTYEKNFFSIFPNPAKDKIFIRIDGNMIKTDFIVVNQFGSLIMRGKLNAETSEIEISDLPTGLYFLHAGERKCIFMKY